MIAATRALFIIVGFLLSGSTVLGGGNTSVVHLSEVHSVKVEPKKITIIGSGHVELRIMTNVKPAKSSVFGQPAQLISAKTTRGTFEIIPYFSDPEIAGVPRGAKEADEFKKLSEKWWKEMKTTYEKVRAGDSVTIGYQEDRITILQFQIEKIIGAGSLTINPKGKKDEKGGEDDSATEKTEIPKLESCSNSK